MKKILYSLIVAAAAFVAGCNNDNLPEANFELFEVESFTATAGDSEASLEWTAADQSTPQEYLIIWTAGTNGVKGGDMTVESDKSLVTIENLVNNVAYTFSIQPRYPKGLAGKISAIATPKSTRFAIENLVAAAGSKKVRLTWTKPESDKLTGYTITVNPGEKTIEVEDKDAERYIVNDLTNDTEYTFDVVANYTNGVSDAVSTSATPGVVSPITVASTELVQNQASKFEYNDMYFINNTVKSVHWAFGDSEVSDELAPVHRFANPNTYTVTVTVTYSDNTTEQGSIEMTVVGHKWTSIASGAVKSSNAVFSTDGTVAYISTAETAGRLHAIDIFSGEIKWSYTFSGTTYGGGAAVGADGTIYQGCQDGKIYAIKPNGTEKWVYTTPTRAQAYPAITSDGKFYAVVNGSANAALHCVNAVTGVKIWSENLEGTVGSAVAVDKDGNVYAGTNKAVYSFTSEGSQRWVTSTALNVTESGSFAINGTTLYAALKAGLGVSAINMADGAVLWTSAGAATGDAYFPIVGKDGTIFFTDKGSKKISALNSDGTTKWTANAGAAIIYGGLVLADDGKLYVGTQGKDASGSYLLCTVDAASGAITTQAASEQMMSAVTIAPDKRLYYGTTAGNLKAVEVNANLESASWSVRGGNLQGTNSLK